LFAIVELPESDYYILSMTKAGYQSNLQLAIPNIPTTSLMFTEQEISTAASSVGVTYPASNTGLIVFIALDEAVLPVSGYRAAVAPQSGSGPFYAGEDGTLGQSLAASSSIGWGVFFNLSPANYQLDFTHPSTTCEVLKDVPVVGGFLTYVITGCN
jgi:hypothetical protein